MATLAERLNTAVDSAETDAALLNQFVNADDQTDIDTDNGPLSSLAKFQRLIDEAITLGIGDFNAAAAAVDQAKTDAETARDDAQAAAATLALPPIQPGDVGKILQVKATEDGYELVDNAGGTGGSGSGVPLMAWIL